MKKHSEGFLNIVNEARTQVEEISAEDAQKWLSSEANAVLLDVREDFEWQNGRAEEAVHLAKGILERDIEKKIPNKNTPVVMYCAGGYRSILTCEVAQRMGYTNVKSLAGGLRAMLAVGWPTNSGT